MKRFRRHIWAPGDKSIIQNYYPEARKEKNNCYYIPSDVEALEYYAFCGAGIKALFIPKSVKKIEHEVYYNSLYYYALFNDSSIKNIYFEGTEEEWEKVWNTKKLDPDSYLPKIEYECKSEDVEKKLPDGDKTGGDKTGEDKTDGGETGGNKSESSNVIIITVSDNLPMDYATDDKGDFKCSYNHSIPFFGKAKPQLDFFGETGIKVVYNNEEYQVSKAKINAKKKRITVTGLKKADGSDAEKDLVKSIKKATK